jgi:hypothetical protein
MQKRARLLLDHFPWEKFHEYDCCRIGKSSASPGLASVSADIDPEKLAGQGSQASMVSGRPFYGTFGVHGSEDY